MKKGRVQTKLEQIDSDGSHEDDDSEDATENECFTNKDNKIGNEERDAKEVPDVVKS